MKPIPNYEWLYSAETDGTLFCHRDGIYTKGCLRKNWYRSFKLVKNKTRKHCYMHRLIALTFLPNPDNKKFVNHINWIPSDNRLENLEWCSHSENMKHARDVICTTPKSKPVMQLTREGILCNIYDSCYEAARITWFKRWNIFRTAQWKFSHCHGYIWKFV